MDRLSGFLNIIILLGALQGFIISSMLFYGRKAMPANRFLAALIFLIALACLNLCLQSQAWYAHGIFPLVSAVVPMVVVMPLGPLLYFYVKALLNPGFKFQKRNRLHFASTLIDLVPYLTAIFFIAGYLTGLLKHSHFDVGLFIDNYNIYSDIPRWLSLTVYVLVNIRYINKYARQSTQYKWLRQLTNVFAAFVILWFIYLVPYVTPAYGNKLLNWVDWYPLYVPMSVLIYWLGFKGYMVAQHSQAIGKKQGATLPTEVSGQAIAALKKAMEHDALYLNPELNLAMLADVTGIPPKTISAVINQTLNKSFNEFVNEYRVNAFKKKLFADDVKHLTIAGIAAECGFNSQATFQRTFRQITGLSPSEYKMRSPAAAG